MAKIKKTTKKSESWWENKIKQIRKITRPQAARFQRATKKFGSLGVVFLVALPLIGSFFLPKNRFQQAKERLIQNPKNFESHLVLAEEFLKNNQFEGAEKELLLAQNASKVLSLNSKLEELWQQKHYSDPNDIRRLIIGWEQIMAEKPDYRDGWLKLALLHYKMSENEKAKEALQKALELDPNFEPTQELAKILSGDNN